MWTNMFAFALTGIDQRDQTSVAFVQELDEKVHSLHDQRMKHLSLERECSRLRQDIDRLASLQPLLDGQLATVLCPIFCDCNISMAALKLLHHTALCSLRVRMCTIVCCNNEITDVHKYFVEKS